MLAPLLADAIIYGFTVFMILATIVAAMLIINRQATKKLAGTVRASLGELAERVGGQNVMVNFRQRLRDQEEAIRKAVPAWEQAMALVKNLTRQLAMQDREWAELDDFLSKHAAGGTANGNLLANKAARMATLEKSREINRTQLASAQKMVDAIATQIVTAKQRLQDLQAESQSLGMQVEFSEQMAKLSQVANVSLLGGDTDLADLREQAQRKIDANEAKFEVGQQLDLQQSASERDAERAQAAAAIITRYQPAAAASSN